MGAYGGLGGQCKTQLAAERFALTHRLFFSGRKLDYINLRPPHNAQFSSTYRSVRLPNSPAFMRTTSIIGGPCYGQAPLAADFFSGRSSIDGDRSPVCFFYLPPSIGLLLTVRTRFFCTRDHIGRGIFAAEHRLTRAILERHHARAASELVGWRSSLPFF